MLSLQTNSMLYGLNAETIESINNVFSNHESIEEVVLYGSRAKGNFQPSSDIDLTLKGDSLSLHDQLKIETELDDLLLPYKIDLSLFHTISNTDLLGHITRVGKIFYKK